MTRGRGTLVLLAALVIGAACEGAGEVGSTDVAADVAVAPDGTGPPSACGGIGVGTFVPGGGATTAGDDSLKLRAGLSGRPFELTVRAGGGTVLLGLMNETVDPAHRPRLGDDGQTVLIGPIQPDTTDAAISGAAFDDVNHGFGGNIVEGRLCFDAPPATGQPLTGSWVFVLAVGATSDLHRIQGTFSVPAEAVTAAPGTLELDTNSATIQLEGSDPPT